MQYNIGNDLALNADIYQEGNKLCALVAIYKNGSKQKSFTLCVPMGKIQKRVLSFLANNTGWGWSDVKKSAKGIARRVGLKQLARRIKTIASDPRLRSSLSRAAKIATQIYPPLGITYAQIQGAAKLLESARKGSINAQDQLSQIADMAKEGDLKSAKVARAMMIMNQAAKKGHNISGWAFNLPYRSGPPLYGDKSSPFHIMRKAYSDGAVIGMPR